jgi:hypothetical protein
MTHRSPETTRTLRVGLIYEGAVVDERIVESPRPVSIGTDPGATLSLDVPELARRTTLVDWQNGRYVLRATDNIEGRLQTDDGIESLAESTFGAETDRDGATLTSLSEVAAGRIALGDAVVLLQRISPAERPEPPSLPAELTRSVGSHLDHRFAGALAVTAILQIGLVAWTQLKDWPEPAVPTPRTTTHTFANADEIPDSTPDPPPTTPLDEPSSDDAPAEQSAESDEPVGDETDSTDPSSNEAPASDDTSPSDEREVAQGAVDDGTVLEALGSREGEDLVADMETASPTDEMDEAIANARRDSDRDDDLQATGGRDNTRSAGRAVGSDNEVGRAPGARQAERGRETDAPDETSVTCTDCGETQRAPDGPTPPPGVGELVQRHAGRFQQCYERALKRNPSLSGKLVVSFRIAPSGRATALRATRDTVGGDVADCVTGVFEKLSFARPDSGSPRVSKTFVFQPAN